jgi:Phosphatidate phosphatase APP1, catalytic domain
MTLVRRLVPLFMTAALAACGGDDDTIGSDVAAATAIPADGTCEADAMLDVVNEVSFETLDDDMRLDRRAAENIVAKRPFASIAELDDVAWVGPVALHRIHSYTEAAGHLAACALPTGMTIGIISDLDKTVVPPADPDLSEAPYPGVTRLYQILEGKHEGDDTYYVTARQPESVTEIPDYLQAHGVPVGPIETGVSGVPWVAEPEKVADVSGILDTTEEPFVLFGDSSHRDPEVYQTIRELYPERIIAGFIHKVNATVSDHRVEGLHLHESYAEVAAILYGYEVLTADEALEVMHAAQQEGLEISTEEMQALLDAQ